MKQEENKYTYEGKQYIELISYCDKKGVEANKNEATHLYLDVYNDLNLKISTTFLLKPEYLKRKERMTEKGYCFS